MSAQREPDVIERMEIERQNALAADWGAREWFQLATTEEREASVRAMLAAVRWLKDHADQLSTNEETRAAVWGVLNFAIAKHEHWLDIGRRAGGKGE